LVLKMSCLPSARLARTARWPTELIDTGCDAESLTDAKSVTVDPNAWSPMARILFVFGSGPANRPRVPASRGGDANNVTSTVDQGAAKPLKLSLCIDDRDTAFDLREMRIRRVAIRRHTRDS
jgi:hypothetical protein